MSIVYKKHELYPDDILIKEFEGTITVTDIIASWEALRLSESLSKNVKGVINDLRFCNMNMSMPEFEKLMDYLKEQDYLKNTKLAVITDTPSTVVFPMLGESQTKLFIKPFCTIESAEDWIINNNLGILE